MGLGFVIVAIGVFGVVLGVKNASTIRFGFVETNTNSKLSASFKYFNGTTDKKVKFKEGKNIVIRYQLAQKSGKLAMKVTDALGNVLESKEGTSDGEITFQVEKTQKYLIQVKGTKAKGKYKITWSEE